MKRLTYNNMMKAIKLIQAKGYDFEESEHLARNCFTNQEGNPSRTIEWFIDQILSKDEYEKEYGNVQS